MVQGPQRRQLCPAASNPETAGFLCCPFGGFRYSRPIRPQKIIVDDVTGQASIFQWYIVVLVVITAK